MIILIYLRDQLIVLFRSIDKRNRTLDEDFLDLNERTFD